MRLCETHGTEMYALLEAGITSIAGEQRFYCPKCVLNEAKREASNAHDAARADHNAKRAQQDLAKRFGEADIPKRFRRHTFETFPKDDQSAGAVSLLQRYADAWPKIRDRGVSVLLLGGPGTGKTGLACSVANVVIGKHGDSAKFITAYGIVRHMRDTWGRRDKTETQALNDLLAPDLLIVDEVGATVGTESELAALFEVINARYAAMRPMILLSNLPMEDYPGPGGAKQPGLRTKLGQRMIDRFADDGSFTIPFTWSSLRGVKRDA